MHYESSDQRLLTLRRRPDLVLARSGDRHLVKDPVTDRFFQFNDEEYTLLELLKVPTSLAQLKEEFQRRFFPKQLSLAQLQRYLFRLHEEGLLLAESQLQGEAWLERRRKKDLQQLVRLPWKMLSWRLPGVSPRRLLDCIEPFCSWMFRLPSVVACLLFVMLTSLFLAVHGEEFIERLPSTEALLGSTNGLWLLAALAVAKTLHELGHAMACRKFGGECSAIGVQFLFGSPCMYANVSDAWLFADRRARIAVSAAGVYVELWLSLVALWVWLVVEPGLISAIAMKVMFVCLIGSLAFNLNPLIKSDGYYILSDWLEIPNLESQSREALFSYVRWWFFGVRSAVSLSSPERHVPWLACFAFSSMLYRAVLMIVLYFVARTMLADWNLEALADLGALLFATMFAIGTLAAIGEWARQARNEGTPWLMKGSTMSVIGLSLAAILLFVPLPRSVLAPVILETNHAKHLYNSVPGRIVWQKADGESVRRGEPILRLASEELDLEMAERLAEQEAKRVLVACLEVTSVQDEVAAAQLSTARESLAAMSQQVAETQKQIDDLVIVSPVDGRIVPATRRLPERDAKRLSGWHGHALDAENLGAEIELGTLVCLVEEKQSRAALALLDSEAIELIEPGQDAQVLVRSAANCLVRGCVSEVARLDLTEVPPQFSAAGILIEKRDERGKSKPLQTVYQVRITLAEPLPDGALLGAIGSARIHVTWQNVWTRVSRWYRSTVGG